MTRQKWLSADVMFLCLREAGVKFYQIEELDEALKGADLVIGGVSSFGVDWFGEMVLPRVADGTPVLTVTKGLMDREDGSLEPYPYLWQRVLDSLGKNVPLCAVGGPCTSYELVAHDQTEVAFCGRDVSVLEYVKSLMQTDYYHISLSTDIMGIESAVALKNGYALGIALTIGLNQKRQASVSAAVRQGCRRKGDGCAVDHGFLGNRMADTRLIPPECRFVT